MTIHRSEDWSKAHMAVNDFLSELLNALRDHNYNPSLHISYDREEHHLVVDPVVLNKHGDIKELYHQYLDACRLRDVALEQIQNLPKLDLGF